ncbi:hypothetical protein PPACK8108_LOCUS17102 [Phakopsora pachyrhizi]|uniref:Uncharacterized protein n=1 Tax=Phakopsora pachyrhizi TaxID=170000 RepID=A0AAV0BC05_PHAPC|nr:hypothetical protein PPACK8108_LOCUS17102 [Phakopsora pachyrhizi]
MSAIGKKQPICTTLQHPMTLKTFESRGGLVAKYRGMNKWVDQRGPAYQGDEDGGPINDLILHSTFLRPCDRAIALPLPLPSHFSIVTCLISSMANLETSGSGTLRESPIIKPKAPGMRYGGISRHCIGSGNKFTGIWELCADVGNEMAEDYYLLPAPYSLPSWKCLAEYRKLSDSESADCAPAQALSDRDTHLLAAF